MVDVLTREQRQLNMSRIRGRDTKPELVLRRGLHALGLRFRLHRRDLPGKPDLVFAGHRAVILVHGCFSGTGTDAQCSNGRQQDRNFGKRKSSAIVNVIGVFSINFVTTTGRVLLVWECALRGPARWSVEDILGRCKGFIEGRDEIFVEISGDRRGESEASTLE